MTLTEKLKELALEDGINFFGVAPVTRWTSALEGYRPTDLLPNAKSVIVLGRKIPRGTVVANNNSYGKYRHGVFTYMHFGYDMVSNIIEETILKLGMYLEEHENADIFMPPSSVGRDEEKMVGMLSNRHAAVCAGLADFGWNGLALTPEVGPRVRWGTLITNLELKYNKLYDGPSVCTQCGQCVRVCPLGALSSTETKELEIDGRKYCYGSVAKSLCRTAVSGLAKGSAGRLQAEVIGKIHDAYDWLALGKRDNRWNKMERVAAMCGRCMITCEAGADRNKFVQKNEDE